MNHSWTPINGKEIKSEMASSRRRCTNCLMEVRYIRRGDAGAHKGWTEVQYRRGSKGGWDWSRDGKLPICKACRTCPTCHGTGVITREKMKDMRNEDKVAGSL